MPYGAKLNLTAGRFDEPEYRKKSADSCGPCYRAHIRGLDQRGPADIGRKPDTVAVVRGEILKIRAVQIQNWLAFLSMTRADATRFVDDCRTRFGNQFITAGVREWTGEAARIARAMHIVPNPI